ncbi:hypothetical protein CSW62_21530 [Caulobacter sp. FWC2]|nr:hypothetical protein CSW62_21530 [Caulobacter sp. FWC2]
MSTWRLPQAPGPSRLIGGYDHPAHRSDMTQDPPASDTLTDSQFNALQSLAERQPGQDSNFVNISAAQALTRLGLARRGGGGWEITPQGRNHLLRAVSRDDADGAANAR